LSARQVEILRTDPVVATAHKEAQVSAQPSENTGRMPHPPLVRRIRPHPSCSKNSCVTFDRAAAERPGWRALAS
jgi:hypothetical protein